MSLEMRKKYSLGRLCLLKSPYLRSNFFLELWIKLGFFRLYMIWSRENLSNLDVHPCDFL